MLSVESLDISQLTDVIDNETPNMIGKDGKRREWYLGEYLNDNPTHYDNLCGWCITNDFILSFGFMTNDLFLCEFDKR